MVTLSESVPPPPPQNVYLRYTKGNIVVSWLKPFPDDNVLVRHYTIDVYHNKTKREAMRVEHKESSVIIYEVGKKLYQLSHIIQDKCYITTTANDLRLLRIFYPRFYPLHLFSYLNS